MSLCRTALQSCGRIAFNMTVFLSLLMLFNLGSCEVDRNSIRLGVQEKILELFSFWESPNPPLLLDLNCELNPNFIQLLVASCLSLRVPESELQPSIDIIAAYSKVLSVRNDQDRLNSALYCHLNYEHPGTANEDHRRISANATRTQ